MCAAVRWLEPQHRIHLRELGMPFQHGPAELAVEGSEPETPAAIVPQHELDALGTQPAATVVEQDRSR